MTALLCTSLTAERWIFLLYAVLYSGISRRVLFPLCHAAPVHIRYKETVLGNLYHLYASLFFAFLHIPDFVFRAYSTVPLALEQRASNANVWSFDGFWGLSYGNAVDL